MCGRGGASYRGRPMATKRSQRQPSPSDGIRMARLLRMVSATRLRDAFSVFEKRPVGARGPGNKDGAGAPVAIRAPQRALVVGFGWPLAPSPKLIPTDPDYAERAYCACNGIWAFRGPVSPWVGAPYNLTSRYLFGMSMPRVALCVVCLLVALREWAGAGESWLGGWLGGRRVWPARRSRCRHAR